MPKGDEKASATPVMRQYLGAKEGHRDALLFFRMGDFYELFYDDAIVAARALDLTLTSRNRGAADEIPMAGVPHHAAASYIQRLLDQGFKVALCEQMADPSKVKGIVPREVVRVVTPAIAYDDAALDARQNLYLVAIEQGPTSGGVGGATDRSDDWRQEIAIASLDLTTGELSACLAGDRSSALGELVRLDPRELLVGLPFEGAARESHPSDVAESLRQLRPRVVLRSTPGEMSDLEATATLDRVLGQGEATLASASSVLRRAAARCVAVAEACEPGRKLPITRLAVYSLGDTLLLDDSTQAHLELVRTPDGGSTDALLGQIDATQTAPGARLLRRRLLAPLTQVADIRRRLDAVELFVTQPGVRAEVRSRLAQVSDLERLAVKFAVERAAPRDLVAARASLGELPMLARALDQCPDKSAREALGIVPEAPWIDPCADLFELLAAALADDPPARASDGGVIRSGYDAALDEARTLTTDGQRLMVSLEGRLREMAQIATLKLRFTRVFGWYMEVTRSHVEKAPASWRRKQTVANAERFTCDELDELADKLLHAEDRASQRESALFADLVRALGAHAARLRDVAARLAEWDVACALAEVAHRDDFVRPDVVDGLMLDIVDGRHPVVEKLAAAGKFVPNDVKLEALGEAEPDGSSACLWLVTGPNMAGKSTLMRQVALIVILAQMGSFVPARQARIGVVDRVLTRVGASDNLSKGESTFMMEMKETANVLRRATRRSLVVLDEIGRGTSTYDGLSIAWAVGEHLHDAIGCRAMFATHYHELTALCETRKGCENWSVSAREHEGDIIFLHKLQRGAASRSYGVACARLAGLPELVLSRAKMILEELEQKGEIPADVDSPRSRTGSDRSSRRRAHDGQLALFGGGKGAEAHPVFATLRAVDVDRLTPLEALQFVATLKKLSSQT